MPDIFKVLVCSNDWKDPMFSVFKLISRLPEEIERLNMLKHELFQFYNAIKAETSTLLSLISSGLRIPSRIQLSLICLTNIMKMTKDEKFFDFSIDQVFASLSVHETEAVDVCTSYLQSNDVIGSERKILEFISRFVGNETVLLNSKGALNLASFICERHSRSIVLNIEKHQVQLLCNILINAMASEDQILIVETLHSWSCLQDEATCVNIDGRALAQMKTLFECLVCRILDRAKYPLDFKDYDQDEKKDYLDFREQLFDTITHASYILGNNLIDFLVSQLSIEQSEIKREVLYSALSSCQEIFDRGEYDVSKLSPILAEKSNSIAVETAFLKFIGSVAEYLCKFSDLSETLKDRLIYSLETPQLFTQAMESLLEFAEIDATHLVPHSSLIFKIAMMKSNQLRYRIKAGRILSFIISSNTSESNLALIQDIFTQMFASLQVCENSEEETLCIWKILKIILRGIDFTLYYEQRAKKLLLEFIRNVLFFLNLILDAPKSLTMEAICEVLVTAICSSGQFAVIFTDELTDYFLKVCPTTDSAFLVDILILCFPLAKDIVQSQIWMLACSKILSWPVASDADDALVAWINCSTNIVQKLPIFFFETPSHVLADIFLKMEDNQQNLNKSILVAQCSFLNVLFKTDIDISALPQNVQDRIRNLLISLTAVSIFRFPRSYGTFSGKTLFFVHSKYPYLFREIIQCALEHVPETLDKKTFLQSLLKCSYQRKFKDLLFNYGLSIRNLISL